MNIRKAVESDLGKIKAIYADAREFMRASGNPFQWGDSYPPTEQSERDVKEGKLYVAEDGGELLAAFYFSVECDPTYAEIKEGGWLNDEPYAVIHRIALASRARGRGVARSCFEFCLEQYPNVRIDTHRDNIPMRRALEKNGFVYCGIISIERSSCPEDDGKRVAYQCVKGEKSKQ